MNSEMNEMEKGGMKGMHGMRGKGKMKGGCKGHGKGMKGMGGKHSQGMEKNRGAPEGVRLRPGGRDRLRRDGGKDQGGAEEGRLWRPQRGKG